ncbi:MAG: hypothetical protein L0206_25960, partial [Actinobacteria bacterium]|nr:hypothetical protein [Actinomycetota bacterium]
MPKLLPCLLVATCVLVNAVDAQATPSLPCLDYAPTNSVDWPFAGYGPGTDFRRVVAGNLEGSEDVDGLDVLALVGSTLVYMPRLHYQTAIFALDWAPGTESTVNDVAVLPGGIAPGKDGLLVSDGDGLYLVELEGGTAFTATTLAAGNPWSSTARLQAADLDGDGACEVLALAADGVTVLVLQGVLGPSPTTSSFLTVGPVLDLEALEWTTTLAGLELAVLKTDGLHVHAQDGTLLRSFPHAS